MMEAQTGPSSPPAPPSAGLDRQRPVNVSPEQGVATTTTTAAATAAATAATTAPTFTTPFGFATPRTRPGLQTTVNQNGSFEFDRVVKSGVVNKRTQKTKKWKSVYLVLRPNTLSLYRTETEDKLRHKIFLSDLTAVAPLKDPKQKRANMFGLFSPARNFHLQASSPEEAQQWISLIRQGAMIEEEEEAMFLASPGSGPQPSLGILVDPTAAAAAPSPLHAVDEQLVSPTERLPLPPPLLSSSPEPLGQPATALPPASQQRHHHPESSHDTAYFSDLSDTDMQQNYQQHYQQQQRPRELSIISLASVGPTPAPPPPPLPPPPSERNPRSDSVSHMDRKSSVSGPNPNTSPGPNNNIETDPDRVMWQGRLLFLRSKGGVRQWKNLWAVLRPRNLIFYKDESEYTARFILPLSAILNVVDIDPVSRSKTHCLQLITEEKSYKMCAPDEESLLQCLGAFKSLLAKRKELEARMLAGGGT